MTQGGQGGGDSSRDNLQPVESDQWRNTMAIMTHQVQRERLEQHQSQTGNRQARGNQGQPPADDGRVLADISTIGRTEAADYPVSVSDLDMFPSKD